MKLNISTIKKQSTDSLLYSHAGFSISTEELISECKKGKFIDKQEVKEYLKSISVRPEIYDINKSDMELIDIYLKEPD